MKKKIAVLVSGNIRLFDQNLPFLKNIFTNFDYSIFAAVWRDQKNLEEFKNLYKPIKIIEITKKNWEEAISKILYVTGEENRSYKLLNIFNMWDSIAETSALLTKYCYEKNDKFDYVLRYRTDLELISFKNFTNQLLNLKNNEILIPEVHNYRGINDQFFFMSFITFPIIEKITNYLILCINNKRVFHSEYLFSQFIKSNSIKIKIINDINYSQLGDKTHTNLNLKPTKTAFIPLYDKIEMKKIKYLLKFKKLQKKIINILY
jgi:hypothetical protein